MEYKIGTTYSMGLPLNGQSVTICVNSYQIKTWYHFDKQQKRSNIISSFSITKGYSYHFSPDPDVSVVYAVLKGDDVKGTPLILMCFHKKFARQFF